MASVRLIGKTGTRETELANASASSEVRMKIKLRKSNYRSKTFGELSDGLRIIMAMLYDSGCDVEYYSGPLMGLNNFGKRSDSRNIDSFPDPIESITIHPENSKISVPRKV